MMYLWIGRIEKDSLGVSGCKTLICNLRSSVVSYIVLCNGKCNQRCHMFEGRSLISLSYNSNISIICRVRNLERPVTMYSHNCSVDYDFFLWSWIYGMMKAKEKNNICDWLSCFNSFDDTQCSESSIHILEIIETRLSWKQKVWKF